MHSVHAVPTFDACSGEQGSTLLDRLTLREAFRLSRTAFGGARLNPSCRPTWEIVRGAKLDPTRKIPGSETEPPGFSGVETLESQTVKLLSGTVLPVGKSFGTFPLKPVATLRQDFAALEQHFAKVDYRHSPRIITLRTRRSHSSLTRVLRALRSTFFLHLESREARPSPVAHHVRPPVGGSPSNDHSPLFCTDPSVLPSPLVADNVHCLWNSHIHIDTPKSHWPETLVRLYLAARGYDQLPANPLFFHTRLPHTTVNWTPSTLRLESHAVHLNGV